MVSDPGPFSHICLYIAICPYVTVIQLFPNVFHLPGYMVGRSVEQFCERVTLLSKFTGFYPNIFSAICVTKLNMFLRTNFSALQSKLGSFSKLSDQGLFERQPQNTSVFFFNGFYCRWQPLVWGETWRKKLLAMVNLSYANFKVSQN